MDDLERQRKTRSVSDGAPAVPNGFLLPPSDDTDDEVWRCHTCEVTRQP